MASTTLSLQLLRNALLKNPNSIKLFSSKAASFVEIRENLSEFGNRTAAPPPSRGDASSENAGSMGTGGQMSYAMLREILKQLRKNMPVEVNMGSNNNVLSGIKLRNIEEKESEADTKVYPYKDLRESLQKLASQREDKKKSSVSCQEADKAEINRRLREKNAALNVRKKKGKIIKPTESSSAMPKTPQEEVPKGSSVNVKRHHITTNDAMVISNEPVNKKMKDDDISFVPSPPENSIVVASAASVTFGQNASSLLVSSEDQDTLVRFTGSACGNQSVAHTTQALKWASTQVAKIELYERQITELKKEVADAKKRATEHLMKLSNVENKADEAMKKLKFALTFS